MSIKRFWGNLSTAVKFILLTITAVIIMLLIELGSNYPALISAEYPSETLYMEDFTCFNDSVAINEDGAHIVLHEQDDIDLIYYGLDTELHSVIVELQGHGPVHVSILVKDESSYYNNQTLYSIFCVADDPALRFCNAYVQSAGEASELTIRLDGTVGADFTVNSVRINAPLPFLWQPVRMALSFFISLLLLCILFLKWSHIYYNKRNPVHRIMIVLPLVFMMVLAYGVSVWIAPETAPYTGMTDEEALRGTNDSYAVLFETLRQGRLSLETLPSEALLALGNPYDPSERTAEGVDYFFDYSLYNGQYYVYFGLAPVLTVYAPYHFLTGRVPASRDVALLLAWLSIVFIGLAVCSMADRYLQTVNVFILSLACVTAVFTSGVIVLLASADFYYLAELSFVCYSAGAIAFGLRGAQQKRRWLSRLLYVVSGICFALVLMSRPNAALLLVAFLAPVFIGELMRKRARLFEAASFLFPALLGVGIVMWYNAARFGSVFDFGALHQLTATDVHFRQVSLADFPVALYHYLFEPVNFTQQFPYISIVRHTVSTTGHYVFQLSCAGMFIYPAIWAIIIGPLLTTNKENNLPSFHQESRWVYWLPLIVSIPIMLISYGIGGVTLRYTYDFRIFYTFTGIMYILSMHTQGKTKHQKVLNFFLILLLVSSIFLGLSMIFENERDYILSSSPQLYFGLQRMFFPFS